MDTQTPFVKCPVCKTSHLVSNKTSNGNGVYASTCESCGHFFKFRKVGSFKTSISFTVNGKQYTVGNELDPWSSLNDFLREKNVSTGTKIVCRQGGCGACIVVAKMKLNPNHPPVTSALNSCLCPLFMVDGWEITTTEGLGSVRPGVGLHTIQKTLADYGGTQCGFCSPGHVMNMYGLMQQYPGLTKQQVEDHFEGSLCRCTGYRPILDAFKSLVPDSTPDIEDLSRKLCRTTGRLCSSQNGQCGGQCSNGPKHMGIQMVFGSTRWYKAVDYADLLNLMQQSHGQTVRLLGANTGTGYFAAENIENFDIVIDVSGVAEFYVNSYDAQTKTFTLGANITLSDLMDIFEAQAAKSTDNGNFNELKKYLYRVASSPIRNRGTWAGNLMLKNKYPDFPSDVFNIFTVLNATITVGPGDQTLTLPQFFKANLLGKCIKQVTFKEFGPNDVVACYKVMPRSQNSLALVNGCFRCTVDSQMTITGQPIISIGGISGTFHRATQTEMYLIGKSMSAQTTLTGALNTLATELIPSTGPLLTSVSYRKTVACSLLYKFFIRACGDGAGVRFRCAKDVLHDIRPLSSGIQTYDSNKMDWPVNEPVKKLEANIQCTGEATYTDDIPAYPGQLYGAFVTSTQANATIQTIDSSAAMKVNGVVRVFTASDVPSAGKNDVKPALSLSLENDDEELLASSKVSYYGQAVALVVAESQEIANKASSLVSVTYTNIQKPVLTMDEAIAAGSLFKKPLPDMITGNPDQAMANAPHVTSGTVYTGEQYHFSMETQSSNCIPTENGGLSLVTPTQWTDSIQTVVARITGLPENKVDVTVYRLGGSYGAKISRNNIPAAACGLAAYLLNRPVKMRMELQTNMEMIGRRFPYRADYKVGYDDTGKLLAVQIHMYAGQGFLPNEIALGEAPQFIDNGYYCANWKVSFDAVKTNKAQNTAVRAPVSTPCVVIIEQVMERVAKELNMDPTMLRQNNLYQQGQMTPFGKKLSHCNLSVCMSELMKTAQVDLRKQVTDYFNRDNRWKKKAMSVVPMKFSLVYTFGNFSVTVNVLGDGTVSVNHGGIEVGQGINTKVAQVVAYKLGVPVSSVEVKSANTVMDALNMTTGGSVTSEQCCKAAITCCDNINARIAPVKAKMAGKTWQEVIHACFMANVLLNEKATFTKPLVYPPDPEDSVVYYSYGACCTEVELDVLTGEYQINRVDIVFDCGESLNPAVDIGQVEGAFIMGVGYNTSEEIKYDSTTGKLLTNDTWGYHLPTNKDIPIDFRVNLLKNAPNPLGVLRSKASGEPPLLMSCSVMFALRKCIDLARKEIGQTGYFTLDNPATVEKVQTACMVDPKQFLLV